MRDVIFNDSTRMDFHGLVKELTENIGATAVQTMAGVKDRTSPHKWSRPDGPMPDADVEARLRLGYRVWRTLSQSEGPNVALAWLMGSNPRLDGELPVLYVQRQLAREVLGAAEAFIRDQMLT